MADDGGMVLDVRPKGFVTDTPPVAPQTGTGGGTSGAVGTRQWIRQAKLSLGGDEKDLSELQISFQVRQADSQHPNWMRIRITNLSDKTADGWMKGGEHQKITFEGGYRGRSGPIFKGTVFQMRKGKEENGTDKFFDIVATANHPAYGYATVSKTLAAGSTWKDVLDECLKPMEKEGVERGFIAELSKKKFPRGITLFGMSRDHLRDLAMANNCSWSIQNEKFQLVKNDKPLENSVKELNSSTGMIGLPEQTIKGIVVKCLLDPGMKIKGQVHINQSSINKGLLSGLPPSEGTSQEFGQSILQLPKFAADGIYTIERVDHDGDMEGRPWYTTLTCLSPSDQSPAAQATRAEGEKANIDLDNPSTGGSDKGTSERGIPEDEDIKDSDFDQGSGTDGGAP